MPELTRSKLRNLPRRVTRSPRKHMQRSTSARPSSSCEARCTPLRRPTATTSRSTCGPTILRSRSAGSALMQGRTHEPVYLHTHIIHSCGGVTHVFFAAHTLMRDHHVGAVFHVVEGIGHAGDFVAEGFVEAQEMVDLGVEGWLSGSTLTLKLKLVGARI